MSGRRRVVGVDFSGARDAGKKIWIAAGESHGGAVEIEACFPACELPGASASLESALPALVEYVAGGADAAFGLDFPFGLPLALVREFGGEPGWERFVAGFDRRFATADAFRDACRDAAGGVEIRRRTDVEAKAPFCVYNLRLYRQTFAGIKHVLRPLVRERRAAVVPFQPPRPGLPTIAEICPASLLADEGLYRRHPYKGRSDDRRRGRRAIVRALIGRGLLREPARSLREVLADDPGGDALDAVLAAIGAARAIRDPTCRAPRFATEAIEGRVFYRDPGGRCRAGQNVSEKKSRIIR